jgi:hypothetical protein
MLLDPLEKELDMPSLLVNICNALSGHAEDAGQKNKPLSSREINI